jgi:hypothetical protein
MTAATRTFGIEIECYPAPGTTKGDITAAIRRRGIQCKIERYGHSTPNNWKVVPDGSLGSRGMEIVSPVLSGEEGIRQVRIIGEVLVAMGATVTTSCGLHVHVGAADLSLDGLKKVAKNYIKFETFFDHIMPRSRRADNNRYVMSNRARFGGYTNDAVNAAFARIDRATTTDDLVLAVSPSRYSKLNYQSMHRYRTVEFRQHSGTVEPGKMTNWVQLCVAFVEASAKSNPRPRTTEKAVTPAEELNRFFNMFSVLEPVRAFYRERMKFFKNTGNTH